MKKTLKILGLTLAVLIGLLIAAAIILPLVFDPNQYKGEIIRLVKENTGRDLKIEKKIGWSFFPRLGVEAGGLELSNAPGFGKEPFARIDAAGVHVEFMPLLSGRIAVDTVFLHGLNLNLAKNAAGKNNWEDLAAKQAKSAKPETDKTDKKESGKPSLDGLSVGRLDIKRANIKWRDAAAGSTLAVRNLELSTGRFVSGEPLDLRLGFELARDKAAPIKAALQSRLTASPDLIKLAKLDLKVDDSRLTGSMEIHNFASPAVRFDLALDKIDLDRYLGGDEPAAAKKGAASQPPAEPVEIPLSMLRSLDINGKFQVGALKAFDLHSTEAKIQIKARNGLIELGPNSARLYQGSYRGETSLDARGKTLQYKINERLDQVQLGPLLKDLQLFDNYSGAANIGLQLTAQGFDARQITRSLNGNAAVAIKDGRINGVDLGKFLAVLTGKAETLAKLTQLVPDKGDHTIFGQMNATFQIKDGVASNSDLKLRAADFAATGRGTADLVNERMDYRVELARFGDEGNKCKTLPVRIKGAFASLGYTPVLDDVLKCQAKKQVEKELGKKLDKGLQDLLKKRK